MFSDLPNRDECLVLFFVPLVHFISVLNVQGSIIGAPVSDVWNGWWSLLHGLEFLKGNSALCSPEINFPSGGCIVPADWTTLIWMLPLSTFLTGSLLFNAALYCQVVMTGLGMYLLCKVWFEQAHDQTSKAPLFSAVLLQVSTVVTTGLHNGSTEVLSLGWVLLALYGWSYVLKDRRWGWFAVLPVVLTSWYGFTGFALLATMMTVVRRPSSPRTLMIPGLSTGVLWFGYGWWVLQQTKGAGNIVRIKGSAEMDSVRRTIGSADPLTYIVPWHYDSPDFSEVSRFGEQFVHSSYIGWVVLASLLLFRKHIEQRWLLWAASIGAVLSMGPVLVWNSEPVVFCGQLGVPLPYSLLESLPLFEHLSLLYRLSWVPIVCLVALSMQTLGRAVSRPVQISIVLCALVESLYFSPTRQLPACVQTDFVSEFTVLKDTPSGAVATYPLAGGRPGLLGHMIHEKPIVGTLNFPANGASLSVLETMRKNESTPKDEFVERVQTIAKKRGVRYLIIGNDPELMPDAFYKGVQRSTKVFPVLTEKELSTQSSECQHVWSKVTIVQLW